MWSSGLKFRSLSHDSQGFQVLSLPKAHSVCSASERTTLSLTMPRTHTRSQRYHLTDSGATSSEAITHASCTIKTGSFRTNVWTVMQWLGYLVLKKLLNASVQLDFFLL